MKKRRSEIRRRRRSAPSIFQTGGVGPSFISPFKLKREGKSLHRMGREKEGFTWKEKNNN